MLETREDPPTGSSRRQADGKKEIKKTFFEKSSTLFLAGFGFVAALAWNEAIKSLFDALFREHQNSIIAKFLYAFLVTFALVIISYKFGKNAPPADNNE